MHRSNPVAALLLALCMSTSLAGCNRKREHFGTTAPRHDAKTLWLNNSSEPEWLDPAKISGAVGGELVLNMFAGLGQWHPSTLESMPEIAERLHISKDGHVYTFRLRPSLWSDGRPVVAEDYAWSWRRVLDPSTTAKYASLLYIIENAAPYNQRAMFVTGTATTAVEPVRALFEKVGPVEKVEVSKTPAGLFVYFGGEASQKPKLRKAAIERLHGHKLNGRELSVKITGPEVVGVRAKDEHTLEVRLKDPVPFFMSLIPYYTFFPVPRHVIERLKREGKNPQLWTRPENIVSNGPYLLKEWKFRQYMILEKNPKYWDAKNVHLERIKVLMVESYNTALNLYQTGELDWSGKNTSLPAEFMDHLKTFKDFRRDPKLSVYWYWVNVKAKPLDDPRVRRALSLAVDRAAIVEHVARGGQKPTSDVVPPGLAGYPGLKSPTYDPERARALLAEAGFPGGEGWPTVTLIYNTSEAHKQISEAVQQMWKKNLGVRIEIQNLEWKVYLKTLKSGDYQLARLGWTGDYADPYTFLEIFTRHSGNNYGGWSNVQYERFLDAANQSTDAAARMALLMKAEAKLAEHSPVIPLYIYTRSFMAKPYLLGLWGNYLDQHPWKYLRVDGRWRSGRPSAPLPDPIPPMQRFAPLTIEPSL